MTHLSAITVNTVPVSRDYNLGDKNSHFRHGVYSSVYKTKDMCHES